MMSMNLNNIAILNTEVLITIVLLMELEKAKPTFTAKCGFKYKGGLI